MKTNIKMRVTPEQAKRVQEICFDNGIFWPNGIKKIICEHDSFLYVGDVILSGTKESFLKKDSIYEEVSADLFIHTNGTCIEDNKLIIEKDEECEKALNKLNTAPIQEASNIAAAKYVIRKFSNTVADKIADVQTKDQQQNTCGR